MLSAKIPTYRYYGENKRNVSVGDGAGGELGEQRDGSDEESVIGEA